MSKPIYSAQTFHLQDGADYTANWIAAREAEAYREGCRWLRWTYSPDRRGLLVEGWPSEPANAPQPFWAMQAAERSA